MKNKLNKILLALTLLISGGAFMSPSYAAGTLAGTSISNTANLAFSIGGVVQSPKASNTVSFIVDNKVNLLIVEDNGGVPTIVSPGSTKQLFKFKLTNLGNSVQDYFLSTSTRPNGQIVFGKTDNFDTLACEIYADSAANNKTYEAAIDTATYVDELAPDATKSVFVLCNIPATRANGDFSSIIAQAVTLNGGTAGDQGGTTQQSTSPNTAGIDVVFADAANAPFDIARDGVSSALGGYLVQSAKLNVVKSNKVLCDPYNFTTNPKNIPGAFVQYSIFITNASDAGASANLGTITDTIDTTAVSFDPNFILPTATSCSPTTAPYLAAGRSFMVGCNGGPSNKRSCNGARQYPTGAADTDGFTYDPTTGTITANYSWSLPPQTGYEAGELKPGEGIEFLFNVQIK